MTHFNLQKNYCHSINKIWKQFYRRQTNEFGVEDDQHWLSTEEWTANARIDFHISVIQHMRLTQESTKVDCSSVLMAFSEIGLPKCLIGCS